MKSKRSELILVLNNEKSKRNELNESKTSQERSENMLNIPRLKKTEAKRSDYA
jgi:hypothetical protein